MKIVIISQNQSQFIPRMMESLSEFKSDLIYVLDRCSDNSGQILDKMGVKYVETDPNLVGRRTSTARNLGLSLTNNEDVLFLDGDRYISEGSIRDLGDFSSDIAVLRLENDHRNTDFSSTYGCIVNGFYSAGIFFRRKVINGVINKYGELFPTWLEQTWGLEDTTLGDICYDLGFSADYYFGCKLHGGFDKVFLDDIRSLLPRLKFRDNLNVRE